MYRRNKMSYEQEWKLQELLSHILLSKVNLLSKFLHNKKI